MFLVIVALLIATILLRTGPRSVSRKTFCAMNLKGIGTSLKVYATENDNWVGIPFDETAIGSIKYTVPVGGGKGTVCSPSRTQPSVGGPGGARELSITRALWTLVRSGHETIKQCICPTSGDTPDPTEDIDAYYDFASYINISYGLHVPFGPRLTRLDWRWHIYRPLPRSRLAVAADKGPYVDVTVATPPPDLSPDAPQKAWAPFNSRNHNGTGQNVLFADGHASFERIPIVGVDRDNIYTIALDNTHSASRMAGESPWVRSAHPYAPVDADGTPLSSTDSVIFP